MDLTAIIILGGLIAIGLLLVWILMAVRRQPQDQRVEHLESALHQLKAEILEKQMEGLVAMRQSLDSAHQVMNQRLAEGSTALDRRMELFGEIQNKLGHLSDQTRNIESIGKNIQSLSDLLRPPKLRGALGELLLENLLAQILPQALFETQYSLAGGQRVDAIVRLADRVLPIDSKFPIEPFQRDEAQAEDEPDARETIKVLKKYVDSIATKYIRPDEGTTDIAIMYIPSEAVYYRFISQSDDAGLKFALSRNVIPSSPGHPYAFLASLAAVYTQAGLTGSNRELVAAVKSLSEALEKLRDIHGRMEGSTRRLSTSLTRANEIVGGMSDRLQLLQEPTAEAEQVEFHDDRQGHS